MGLLFFPLDGVPAAFAPGFLDFVGYPTGQPIYPPIVSRGYKGAGKYTRSVIYAFYMQGRGKRERRLVFSEISLRANQVKEVLENSWLLEVEYRKNLASAQMYTALLSEV